MRDELDVQLDRWAEVAAASLAHWRRGEPDYDPTPEEHIRRLLRYLFDLGLIGREGARYVLPSLDEHFAARALAKMAEVN